MRPPSGTASTLKLLWEAGRHSRVVNSACFLPGGKRILTASSDRTVAQWDAATGREIASLALGHVAPVTAMAVSPDGRRALTACEDGRVRLWDVDAARKLGEFAMPGETITSVAFSPDGSTAVTTSTVAAQPKDSAAGGLHAAADAESAVRLWDLATLKQLPGEGGPERRRVAGPAAPFHRFRETSALAWETVFSPDGGIAVDGDWQRGPHDEREDPPADDGLCPAGRGGIGPLLARRPPRGHQQLGQHGPHLEHCRGRGRK